MTRKFPKLSPKWQAHHMENQETLKEKVQKRQDGKTKDWQAGLLRISRAQAKVNRKNGE